MTPIEIYRRLPPTAKKSVCDNFYQFYAHNAIAGTKLEPEKANRLYRNYLATFGTTKIIFDMELNELFTRYSNIVLCSKRWIDKYPECFI